jgi:hypothetical protein
VSVKNESNSYIAKVDSYKDNLYYKDNSLKETLSFKETGYKEYNYEANNYKDYPISNYKDKTSSNNDIPLLKNKENNDLIKLIPAKETEQSTEPKPITPSNNYKDTRDLKDFRYTNSSYNLYKKPVENNLEDNTGKFDTEELMDDSIHFKDIQKSKFSNDYVSKYNYYDNNTNKKDSPKKNYNYMNEAAKKHIGDSPDLKDIQNRNKYQSEKRIYRDVKSKTVSGSQDNSKCISKII